MIRRGRNPLTIWPQTPVPVEIQPLQEAQRSVPLRLWRNLRPFSGYDVRRLVSFYLVFVGLAWTLTEVSLSTRVIETRTYGLIFITVGVVMLATLSVRGRYAGKFVACLAAGLTGALFLELIRQSPVSSIVLLVIFWAALGEALYSHES